jgi:hypothetical protein
VKLGSLRRLNPLEPDGASLTEPPFDARKQHVLLGALSAIELVAGAALALPFLGGVAVVAVGLIDTLRGRHYAPFHSLHHLSWYLLLVYGACTLLAVALLWAGQALMFGRPYRYRAQGVLLVTVLTLVLLRKIALLAL